MPLKGIDLKFIVHLIWFAVLVSICCYSIYLKELSLVNSLSEEILELELELVSSYDDSLDEESDDLSLESLFIMSM